MENNSDYLIGSNDVKYLIGAYYEGVEITKISYEKVRYFDNNIYKLLDCYDLLDGGDLFINYRDIEVLKKKLDSVEKSEQDFIHTIDGYDLIELRFSTY